MKKQQIRQQRGMAFAGTMLVLLVIMSVMMIGVISKSGTNGVMTATNNSDRLAAIRMNSVSALNMADAGVDYTIQWLSLQPLPPAPPDYANGAFAPPLWGSSQTGSPARSLVIPISTSPGNYFSVEIYPDASNTNNVQKKYLIESVGVSNGTTQIVRAYVEQSSLSKWLVLLDSWDPPNNFWVSGLTTFDGPVHDNNNNGSGGTTGQAENVLWKSAVGSAPIFTYTGTDAYSVSGSNVNWFKDSFGTPGAPVTSSDWHNVATNGMTSVQTGAATVGFPSSSLLQHDAALGTATAPTTTGIAIPNTGSTTKGGIYIHNDVDNMKLSVDPTNSTTQIIEVWQTDSATGNKVYNKITLNQQANTTSDTTTVTTSTGTLKSNTTTSYTGVTNGVVYADGNVGSQAATKSGGLYGVVADNVVSSGGQITHRSSLTIATDAAKNLNLAGNVTYKTQRQRDASGNYLLEPNDTNFTTHAGTLGIISNNVLVDTKDYAGSPLNAFEMDGTVLAYSVYDADQWATRPVGTWENMGGYLSKVVGVFGQFNASNVLTTGFNTQFNYDQRMRNTPPPYFPTTGNQYDIISWQRVASTLQ